MVTGLDSAVRLTAAAVAGEFRRERRAIRFRGRRSSEKRREFDGSIVDVPEQPIGRFRWSTATLPRACVRRARQRRAEAHRRRVVPVACQYVRATNSAVVSVFVSTREVRAFAKGSNAARRLRDRTVLTDRGTSMGCGCGIGIAYCRFRPTTTRAMIADSTVKPGFPSPVPSSVSVWSSSPPTIWLSSPSVSSRSPTPIFSVASSSVW